MGPLLMSADILGGWGRQNGRESKQKEKIKGKETIHFYLFLIFLIHFCYESHAKKACKKDILHNACPFDQYQNLILSKTLNSFFKKRWI